MFRKLLITCAIFAVYLFGVNASAQTVTSQGYLLTGQAVYSLNELEAQTFTPYDGVLNRGYGNDYLWLKLHVAPGDTTGTSKKIEDWILRIRPTYLGEIALYDTRDIQDPSVPLLPQRFTGQQYSSAQNGYDAINHGFLISPADVPRDIYLRLKTSTTRLISAEVLTESKAHEEDRKQLILTSSFLSILAFFLIWAALQWLIMRERLLALFFVKQTIVFAYGLTYLGYMKLIFGEHANWGLIDAFVQLNNFAYIGILYLFEITFLSYFVTDKRYCEYAYLVLIAWLFSLVMYFAGFRSFGLQINMYLALVAPAIFLFLVFKTKPASELSSGKPAPLLSKKVLLTFYLFYVLAAYLVVLPNIGIIKAKEFTLTSAMYVSIVSAALMTTLLILRTRNLNRHKADAERDAGLAQQRLAQEQAQREQQSRFISMLTHELKTPISVAKLSLDAMRTDGVEHDRIQRALVNMNDVVERCRISDALEGHRFQVRYTSFGLREAVFERIDLLMTPERVKVFEGNEVFVDSDLQLVSIIIANLLDNALKYSPDESNITVRICQKTKAGKLGASLVVNNQIGLAGQPDADKVFQKYYRAKTAEGKSGSGLGLYLTAGIADLLGGEVTYRTADSRIEFELWLPD